MAGKSKKSSQTTVKNYIDLFYMTPCDVSAKEIFGVLQNSKDITLELWEDMNILELELANEDSVDFEPMNISFKDPSDAAFVKNRNVKTIFAINLCETDLNITIPYFDKIVEKYSGFVCADSKDFTPVYSGSSQR